MVRAHRLRQGDADAAERATGWLRRLAGFDHRAIGKLHSASLRVGGSPPLRAPARYCGTPCHRRSCRGWTRAVILDYKALSGALGDTDQLLLREVEEIIQATREVASCSRRTGLQLGDSLTEADEGDFVIRLKGGSRRPMQVVISHIRRQIAARVSGLQTLTMQLLEVPIGDLTAVPPPVEIKLFGDDLAELERTARRVADAIANISGAVEVVDRLRVAGDAVVTRLRPGAVGQHGFDPASVADQVETLIAAPNDSRAHW